MADQQKKEQTSKETFWKSKLLESTIHLNNIHVGGGGECLLLHLSRQLFQFHILLFQGWQQGI